MTEKNEWVPIGATARTGSWAVLWGKKTDDGWKFRSGEVGGLHVERGTPDGVVTPDTKREVRRKGDLDE